MKFKIKESLEFNLIDKFFKDSSWIDEIRDRLQYLNQKDLEIEYNEDPSVKLIIDNAHEHNPEDNDYEGIIRDFINFTEEFMFSINDEDKESFNELIKENPFMETFFKIYDEEWPEWNTIKENINEAKNPYFTPYGYRDAAKVLNRTAPEYYWHLKEIEMDRGDGIKLANYALKKGLPVMVDPNDDPDYPTFYLEDGSSVYHWNDYFYPYETSHYNKDDLIPYTKGMFNKNESLDESSDDVQDIDPNQISIFDNPKNESQGFVIALDDGSASYISNKGGKYHLVGDIRGAKIFKTYEEAQRVIDDQLHMDYDLEIRPYAASKYTRDDFIKVLLKYNFTKLTPQGQSWERHYGDNRIAAKFGTPPSYTATPALRATAYSERYGVYPEELYHSPIQLEKFIKGFLNDIGLEESIKGDSMKFKVMNESKESKICCICKKPFDGYGNNAEPVCSGSCCDECNIEKVIPMRFKMMKDVDEGYRKDPKVFDFHINDRVAERWNDGEFNVGTVIDIKEEDGKQYLVRWDYSDGPSEEWLYGDVLTNWIEEINESLNEALEDYKLTYYLSTATAERRPETIEDVENDWKEEVFEADSDYDACKYAFSIINDIAEEDLDEYLDDYDIKDVREFVEYCEEKDLGDGLAFVVKLEGPNGVIYDMGQTKDDFIEQVKENDEMLAYYRKVLGIDESLNEGNPVSDKIPESIDNFLQDIAQMYQTIDYGDIMDHDYSEEDIKKLKSLRRKFREEAQYEGDEEAEAAMNDIAEKVAVILKAKNESKELNESTNQYILFGFNHFSPDDLWEIKDSKENLEALISTYGEGPLEYNEIIEDKGNLLFVEHNDEFISVQDTGYKTIEDFKKALYNTLDPMIQADLESGEETGEYEFDIAPYHLYIDELTTTQAAVDYAMELIEDSYVDGDSNSEYRFVDPKTITDNADMAREGLGDVGDQAWDDSWEEDIEEYEESLSSSKEVRIAETLYKGNSILEDYDDLDDEE